LKKLRRKLRTQAVLILRIAVFNYSNLEIISSQRRVVVVVARIKAVITLGLNLEDPPEEETHLQIQTLTDTNSIKTKMSISLGRVALSRWIVLIWEAIIRLMRQQ
jgi:hypothetical protein